MNMTTSKRYLWRHSTFTLFLVVSLVLMGLQPLLPVSRVQAEVQTLEQSPPPIPPSSSAIHEDSDTLEGTGTHFELTKSHYINVKMDSSETIRLSLTSVPSMITMHIDSTSSATSTQLTIGGFAPLTTYHMYEDGYSNHIPITTDENGSFTYNLDITQPHAIFIQPRPSTIILKSDGWQDSSGQDPHVGTWDPVKKLAILTEDITQSIEIDGDGITLDGNGHTSTLPGGQSARTGYGVHIGSARTGVTIKNIKINNFYTGIAIDNASNNAVENNTVVDCYDGIGSWNGKNNIIRGNYVNLNKETNYYAGTGLSVSGNFIDLASGNNVVANNTIQNCGCGFEMRGCNGNTLTGNRFEGSRFYNFGMSGGDFGEFFNHDIDTTNLVDGKPIYYIRNANNLTIDSSSNAGLVYLINCNNITVKDITATKGRMGICLCNTHNSLIENVNASGNGQPWDGYGMYFIWSTDNTIKNCITNVNSYYGIYLRYSTDNTLTGNIASTNIGGSGIYLDSSTIGTIGNIISGNTLTRNGCGLVIYSAQENQISNNLISNNRDGIYVNGYSNIFKSNSILNCSGVALIDNNWWQGHSNTFYNNNFVNNQQQAMASGTVDIFNLPAPIGGNYWSNWGPPEHPDNNGDGFVDDPYKSNGVVDNLPWVRQDGWLDSAAPTTTATLTGTLGNAGWYISDVQVKLSADDSSGGSGVKETDYSFDGTNWNLYINPFTISANGATTIYYRSTDNMGNVETTETQTIKIDNTLPIVTGHAASLPNTNGWNNTDVVISFSAEDTPSGIATVDEPVTVTKEGKDQIVTGHATDTAGNMGEGSITLNIDKTTPEVVQGAIEGTTGENGWYTSDVTVNYTASDALSGLKDSSDASFSLITSAEGANVSTGSKDIYDKADNKTVAGPISFKVDKTAPTTMISNIFGVPGKNGWYTSNVQVTLTAVDNLSGVDKTECSLVALSGTFIQTRLCSPMKEQPPFTIALLIKQEILRYLELR